MQKNEFSEDETLYFYFKMATYNGMLAVSYFSSQLNLSPIEVKLNECKSLFSEKNYLIFVKCMKNMVTMLILLYLPVGINPQTNSDISDKIYSSLFWLYNCDRRTQKYSHRCINEIIFLMAKWTISRGLVNGKPLLRFKFSKKISKLFPHPIPLVFPELIIDETNPKMIDSISIIFE